MSNWYYGDDRHRRFGLVAGSGINTSIATISSVFGTFYVVSSPFYVGGSAIVRVNDTLLDTTPATQTRPDEPKEKKIKGNPRINSVVTRLDSTQKES
jgi:hypothetical protein